MAFRRNGTGLAFFRECRHIGPSIKTRLRASWRIWFWRFSRKTPFFGLALYFSRSPIPHVRADERGGAVFFKHIGLYVYQRDFLLTYSGLPVGPLEKAERLEQLRALENGHGIRVVETEYESLGVDTPADLERVSQLFEVSLESAKRNG